MEVELEEYCITVLEEVRPVGDDLRFVVAVLKINDCLERIADLAENIAEAVRKVDNWEGFGRVHGCNEMAQRSQAMLMRSLEALVKRDAKLARIVIDDDHFVDEMRNKLGEKIAYAIDNSTASAGPLLRLEYVTRQLERIGDLATNIAEDVIFMLEGQIVRHPSRFDGDNDILLDRSGGRFRRVT
jgi:phosphate transport system protein